MRIQKLNHSSYQHQYHIVWGTKYRRKWLKNYVKSAVIKSFNQSIEKYPTLFIINLNTDEDHIHIQIEIPPDVPVSRAVQVLKQRSSIELKKRYKYVREMYLEDSIWSVGYFSSTIGLNETQIAKYIEWQGRRELPKQTGFEFS